MIDDKILVNELVDKAMRIAMFDQDYDDLSKPEIVSARKDFSDTFSDIISRLRKRKSGRLITDDTIKLAVDYLELNDNNATEQEIGNIVNSSYNYDTGLLVCEELVQRGLVKQNRIGLYGLCKKEK